MGAGPEADAPGPAHRLRQDRGLLQRGQGRGGPGRARAHPGPPRRAAAAGRRQAPGRHRPGVRGGEGGGDQPGQLVPRHRRQRAEHDEGEAAGALPRRLLQRHRGRRGAPRAVGQLPRGARPLPRRQGAGRHRHRRPRRQARPGPAVRERGLRVHAADGHPRGVPVPHPGADRAAVHRPGGREGERGRLRRRRPGHGARPVPGPHRRRDAGGGVHAAQDRGVPAARGNLQEVRGGARRQGLRRHGGRRRERGPGRGA